MPVLVVALPASTPASTLRPERSDLQQQPHKTHGAASYNDHFILLLRVVASRLTHNHACASGITSSQSLYGYGPFNS